MNKLLIIDGHAIMHRAFHALPPMSSSNGTPTNAVHGFFAMIHTAVKDFTPTHLAIAFDTPTPTFRKELLEEYQASRPEPDSQLIVQFKVIREILESGGIACLEAPGFEADDVIGTLATSFKAADTDVYILTGDKDILQLVQPHVHVIVPKIGLSQVIVYDAEKVVEKMGVPPDQIPDFKALAGDPSDNYQGVKGLGPKTAIKLLQQFGSIEGIYEKIDTMPEDRMKGLLVEYKEKVLVLKVIATIKKDLDLGTSMDKMKLPDYGEGLLAAFEKYQLNSLIKRYYPDAIIKPKPPKMIEKPKSPSQMDLF